MNTHTTLTGVPNPPAILSGQAIYDLLMKDIEPELTSDQVKLLKGTHTNETPAQKKKRAERYNKAFAEYDRRFAVYKQQWDRDFNAYKRAAMAHAEESQKGTEETALQNLESSLNAE